MKKHRSLPVLRDMNIFVRDGVVDRKRRRRYRFELNECQCPKSKKTKTDDWTPLSDVEPLSNNDVSPLCEAVEPPVDDDDVPLSPEADDVAEPLACDPVSESDLDHHNLRQDYGCSERMAVSSNPSMLFVVCS